MRRVATVFTLAVLAMSPLNANEMKNQEVELSRQIDGKGPNCREVCSPNNFLVEKIECEGEGSDPHGIRLPIERFEYPQTEGIESYIKRVYFLGIPLVYGTLRHIAKVGDYMFSTEVLFRGTAIRLRMMLIEDGEVRRGYHARLPTKKAWEIVAGEIPPILEDIPREERSIRNLDAAITHFSQNRWEAHQKYFFLPTGATDHDKEVFLSNSRTFYRALCGPELPDHLAEDRVGRSLVETLGALVPAAPAGYELATARRP